ncbi:MAG: SDR family oxidoreductase [Planctomycetes bacterium]|nr:SDR family oxidoreductase [Planctomycetota bacterium]
MTATTSQTILLTGASTGFGNLTAQRLLHDGHHVIASMRDPEGRNLAPATQLEELAKTTPGSVTVLDIDVTDSESIDKGVKAALAAAGPIDVLVNNAGQAFLGPFEAFSDAQLRAQFEVNFFGAASMIRAVMPGMRESGKGLFVNLSSGLGRAVFPGTGVYSASKFAMEAMSEAIRYEASAFGVDSVTVEPGAHATPIVSRFVEPEDKVAASAYGPIGNTVGNWQGSLGEFFESGGGNPNDVVEAIVSLIEADPSKRPARVAVGQDVAFVQELNKVALAPQIDGLKTFGMEDFTHLVR